MSFVSIMALIRHALTFAGGALVTLGWLDTESVTELVGAVTTLIGIVWSLVDKKMIESK